MTLQHHFFQAQDHCNPEIKKLGKSSRRLACMSKELMGKQTEGESLQNMEKGSDHLEGIEEHRACRDAV